MLFSHPSHKLLTCLLHFKLLLELDLHLLGLFTHLLSLKTLLLNFKLGILVLWQQQSHTAKFVTVPVVREVVKELIVVSDVCIQFQGTFDRRRAISLSEYFMFTLSQIMNNVNAPPTIRLLPFNLSR